MNSKNSFLEDSAKQYHSQVVKGWKKLYRKKRYALYGTFKKHFHGKKVLELGCADGVMTQWLASDFESVTVVDAMMIKRLAFFMVLNNRDIAYVDVSKDLTKEIQMLVEALGVSGKQRNSIMNQKI